MPFKSCKQEKYMFKNHPEIAKEWVKKYGSKCREIIVKNKGKK